MSDESAETLADKERQIAELEAEIARSQVSRETGVPIGLLANGQTAEEIERIATDALCWRAESPPSRPPTAAVPASTVTSADRIAMATGQVTSRDQLAQMSPAQRMQAWREGRLQQIGVSQPPPPRSTPMDRR
jgi:hypothetical protein